MRAEKKNTTILPSHHLTVDDELVKVYTGKSFDKILDEYSLPELHRLSTILTFIKHL
jgi:hypothetical protein